MLKPHVMAKIKELWDSGIRPLGYCKALAVEYFENGGAIIRAEVHSDDFARTADFDATPWFLEASKGAIVELAECGWRGDYPADRVAQFIARQNPEVEKVLDYATLQSEMGFECSVNEADARAWLKENRKAVLAYL